MADVPNEEVHGFKLVLRGSYAPFFSGRTSPPQRYVPGTTQWIEWDDWGGSRPPPALKLCSQSALHFCRRAFETVEFIPHNLTIDNLTLLRVTPVRWPTTTAPTTTTAPLFVEEEDVHEPAKCGAYGLRVDGEVTDVDERRALLSGEIEKQTWLYRGRKITTIVDGHAVKWKDFDVLGNCIADRHYDDAEKTLHNTCYSYVLFQAADAQGDEIETSLARGDSTDVSWLANCRYRAGDTVVYGEVMAKGTLRVIKQYDRTSLRKLVVDAIEASTSGVTRL